MTIKNCISEELSKYVYFNKDGVLTHTDDMPETLEKEFTEKKEKIKKHKNDKRQELLKLLEGI